MTRIITAVCLYLLLSSFDTKPKKFPEISYVTSSGQTFTNNNFKDKNSIVVLFHLGCPPAMSLLKDIQEANLDQNSDVQIVGIVANTPQQIKDFNSTADNDWSDLREQFSLEPVKIPLIGECDADHVRKDEDGNVVLGKQCTNLGKKIKTRYSPTLVYVNRDGNIIKVLREYPGIEALTETSSIFIR
jgi:hypothetical protein